jgi:hypothetical protein
VHRIVLMVFFASYAGMSSLGADEIEEGVSYPYPFFNEDGDSIPDKKILSKEEKKEESKTARTAKVGRFTFSADVKNADKLSQTSQQGSDWEKMQKENRPKGERRSRLRKDREEKDDSPEAVISFKWTND